MVNGTAVVGKESKHLITDGNQHAKGLTFMKSLKAAYGEKYDFAMMAGCKQEVASLLHEETEIRSVREQLLQRRYQQAQQKQTPKKNRDSRER